jgi:hypothetical protein
MNKTMQSLTDQLPLVVNKLVVYIDTVKTREAIYGAIKVHLSATPRTNINRPLGQYRYGLHQVQYRDHR